MTTNLIAERYDALRKSIPAVRPPDVVFLTRGVVALGADREVLELVRDFDTFTEANDPHGEHDFGSFSYEGHKIFWKIDNYDGQDGHELVLTVMLADEY